MPAVTSSASADINIWWADWPEPSTYNPHAMSYDCGLSWPKVWDKSDHESIGSSNLPGRIDPSPVRDPGWHHTGRQPSYLARFGCAYDNLYVSYTLCWIENGTVHKYDPNPAMGGHEDWYYLNHGDGWIWSAQWDAFGTGYHPAAAWLEDVDVLVTATFEAGGYTIASYHFDYLYRDYFDIESRLALNQVWNDTLHRWEVGPDSAQYKISNVNTAPTLLQADPDAMFNTWNYDRQAEIRYFDRMRDNYTGQTTDASQAKYYPVEGAESEPSIYQNASDLDRTEWYGYVMSIEERLQGVEWALNAVSYANASAEHDAAIDAIGYARYHISGAAYNAVNNRSMNLVVREAWLAVQNYTKALNLADKALLLQYKTEYPAIWAENSAYFSAELAEINGTLATVQAYGDVAPSFDVPQRFDLVDWVMAHWRLVLGGVSLLFAAIALITRHPYPIIITAALFCCDLYVWAGELL